MAYERSSKQALKVFLEKIINDSKKKIFLETQNVCLEELNKALVRRLFVGRTVVWPLRGVEMSGTVIVAGIRPRMQRLCKVVGRRCVAKIGLLLLLLLPGGGGSLAGGPGP